MTLQQSSPGPQLPDIDAVKQAIAQRFPKLWPAIEAGMATAATLLLSSNENPATLIYLGGPSAGKTTAVEMFTKCRLCYRSDSFTTAAFVSHASNVQKSKLGSVDLLPRIKHKVLLTPELAPTFRGKEDELTKRFTTLTTVLDGRGLTTDSGTHGQRGYTGDYLFAWLGGSTLFHDSVWRIMAQLGSRLFFYEMQEAGEVSVDDLLTAQQDTSYQQSLAECREIVAGFFHSLFDYYEGVRKVQWSEANDPKEVLESIGFVATLLARMRSEPATESGSKWSGRQYQPASTEAPHRAFAMLRNLARAHALLHGRLYLCHEDLPVVAQVAVSTMPTNCRLIFKALVGIRGHSLSVGQVQKVLGVAHRQTARTKMDDLARRNIVRFVKLGTGRRAVLRFTSQWKQCATAQFREWLRIEPVKKRGV